MKVEIYSDVACPWCYIGERRFQRALAAFPRADEVEVVFRPYQLDPGAPAEAVPLKAYLERRFGRPVDDMLAVASANARSEGLELNWDRALSANTLTAHRLMWLAEREHGAAVQRVLADKLFEAYFTKGGDVSDPELLASLAVEAGMDGDRVRAFLASDEGLAETEAEIERARSLGITAVPTFVIDGKWAVQGAQPASTFLRVLEEVAAQAAQAPDAGDGGDACADGHCAV